MKVLAFSCTHAPFTHPDALDFLRDLKREYRPDTVVCLGDLGDQHGWSRHERQPDALGQADEDRACLAWCKQLYKVFKDVKACIGNHDTRLAKTNIRAGLPSRFHIGIRELYQSPKGWDWQEMHLVDGTYFLHGDACRTGEPALFAARALGGSVAIGHYHQKSGVKWEVSPLAKRFALSVGCLVDETSPGMRYAKVSLQRSAIGAAVIIDRVPRWIPLEG